ncbi:MAG: choice-of-anchor B family protein [Gemmatimonadales bacterium]
MARLLRRPATILLVALAACGGDATGPSGADDSTPASVVASRDTVSFTAVGSQVALTAVVKNGAGMVLDTAVIWSHRDSTVASVSPTGLLTATGPGTDTVFAAAGRAADTVVVTVSQVPASIAITLPGTLSLVGATAQLTAQVRDANGNLIPGPPVAWSSSNAAVLPVSALGVLTVGGIDTATISATSGAVTAGRAVTVNVTGPVGGAIVGAPVSCTGGMAGPFPCTNMDLLAYLPPAGVGTSSYLLDDLWGWTDPVTGTEWALVGRGDGIAFVDLSDPTRPALRGFLPATTTASIWHDVKVYADHAFIVSDNAGQHGMQVFDLRRLRGVSLPATFQPDAVYTRVGSVHNIAIDAQTGFAYLVGSSSGGTTCGGGLHMVDIRTPTAPVFAGCFADTTGAWSGYVHDAQCVPYTGPDPDWQNREICFDSAVDGLGIVDVTNKTAPALIAHNSYPNRAYSHQGWLSEDQRWFYLNDELDEGLGGPTRTLIWDVADLDDPVLAGEYYGPTNATDHNNYVVGTRLFASNYQYGVRVLDIGNPAAPGQIGHFDTAPDEPDTRGFGGSWSNYPFFASGILVVTSRSQGLFILQPK